MAALQDSNHKPLIPLTIKLQGVILETQRNAKIQRSKHFFSSFIPPHAPNPFKSESKFRKTFLLSTFPLHLGEMDAVDSVVDPLREFAKDSVRLVKRCHKPDRKEFTKVAVRTAIGFVVMGFVGLGHDEVRK
ncbi:Protein transport protein Sec61 subunit gamma, partial [Cucurbita argyrosperma subsp. sororia]